MLQQFGLSTFPACQQEAKLYFESGTAAVYCAVSNMLLTPLAPYHGPFCNPLRLQLGFARLLKTVSIWPMRSHHAVQAGPSGLEAFLLCFVVAFDEPHELTHAVSWRRHREEMRLGGITAGLWAPWHTQAKLGLALGEVEVPKPAVTWKTSEILQARLVKLYRFYCAPKYLDSETEFPNEGALKLVDLCFSYHLKLCKYYACMQTAWWNLIFTD